MTCMAAKLRFSYAADSGSTVYLMKNKTVCYSHYRTAASDCLLA